MKKLWVTGIFGDFQMRQLCGLLLTGMMITFLAVSEAVAGEPYSLRGFQLGMSLDEFTTIPFPDGDKKADMVSSCSSAPYLKQGEVGAIACVFFNHRVEKDRYATQREREAARTMLLANIAVVPRFYFTADAQGVLRLSMIIIWTGTDNYLPMQEALTQKYGMPRSVTPELVQNSMGAVYDNEKTTWSNEVSEIVIIQRDRKIDSMTIRYSHLPLAIEASERRKAVEGDPVETL